MSLSTYALSNVVVRLQNPEWVAVYIALGNPTRKSSEAATGATRVTQFSRPAAFAHKYLLNPWQRLRKVRAQKSVRNLAYGLFASKAVHVFRSTIPIDDAILLVADKNRVGTQ